MRTVMQGIVGITVGAVLAGAGAAFLGAPTPCADRKVAPTPAAAAQLKSNWSAFLQQAARGPATMAVTEDQATSQAADWLQQRGAPLTEVRIYFCSDGHADAAATLTSFGAPVHVVAGGTLDVSGGQPSVRITSVRMGSLPGVIGAAAANSAITAATGGTLPLKGLTDVRFTDGRATLAGGPAK